VGSTGEIWVLNVSNCFGLARLSWRKTRLTFDDELPTDVQVFKLNAIQGAAAAHSPRGGARDFFARRPDNSAATGLDFARCHMLLKGATP
jgi:hypothetical protein